MRSKKAEMYYYFQILKKYKVNLLISPLLVLLMVFSETIQPWFMAKIIDDGVMLNDMSTIISSGSIMASIAIGGLFIGIANAYISSQAAIGFGTDLRSLLFNKLQDLSLSEIDQFQTASLITRLTNDVTRIQQVILMGMRLMLRSPIMLVLSTFFVIKINQELALILIGVVPVLGIGIFIILRKAFPLFIKVQQKVDQLNGVVRENLINIRVVKSFVRERHEVHKFERSSDDLRDMVTNASNTVVTIFPMMQLVMNLSVVLILWFGGNKVINGNLKVGELISFINYIMQILMALMLLSMVIMNISRAAASSQRIKEVLKAQPSIVQSEYGKTQQFSIKEGKISFQHVSFHYQGGENDVLKNINFTITPGETIAIVGATGAAKSTLVHLIPRLYDVTEGKILIDDKNVKDYSLEVLQSEIGMVLQKNELFSGTIIDNLRWGKEDATLHEIEEASRAAQAHEFILSFEKGYETILGRGGINVSGGQKQRLCIARAILRKPKILILDDSTSAVDTETEKKIRQNLHSFLKDSTVFVITQRLHTMQAADRIIVLDDGKIEAIGNSSQLKEKSSIYQEICYSQQINS